MEGTFTYRIPEEMQGRLSPGMVVIVQFGKQKFYSGVIRNIHSFSSTGRNIKDISLLQEDTPVVNDFQLRLWHWIAAYYMCTMGEVCNAALPSGFRLESETRFVAGELCPGSGEANDRQQKILDAVSEGIIPSKYQKNFSESAPYVKEDPISTKGRFKKRGRKRKKLRPATVTK